MIHFFHSPFLLCHSKLSHDNDFPLCTYWPSRSNLRMSIGYLQPLVFICSRTRSPRIPALYWIAFVDFNSSNCDRKGQSYPVECYLESLEGYSEGKIDMSEPESGNGIVNTVYFVIRPGEILESVARSLFTMKEHAIMSEMFT